MATKQGPRRRPRGTISALPSGALRVRVYAGTDPITGKDHLPAGNGARGPVGPKAAVEAERVRTRLLKDVDDGRQPKTSATVAQLMERYLGVIDIDDTTRVSYEGLVRRHIVPLLGTLPLGRVRGEVLGSFYRQLRTCRTHRQGAKNLVDHRTERARV